MILQCNIEREGSTWIKLDKFQYEFKPRPELTNGDAVTPVCQVLSTSHVSYLLKLKPDFEQYVPPVVSETAAQSDAPDPLTPSLPDSSITHDSSSAPSLLDSSITHDSSSAPSLLNPNKTKGEGNDAKGTKNAAKESSV